MRKRSVIELHQAFATTCIEEEWIEKGIQQD